MKLLAVETSTEACSVALWIDGQLRERFEIAPRRHTELVLPWADELLADAGIAKSQLDAIAVGRGPGAFTGVRLAVALVQGMAMALDKPVLPISTLAALAMQGSPVVGDSQGPDDDRDILAAIDARMGEL
jgi:tRNA threonylcarbamoyladenosine biosynthesis protein TsaB